MLLPGAKWGLSAWPLYLVASLILAWVVVDLRAHTSIGQDRRESTPTGSPADVRTRTEEDA
jgi:hypothetical protein